MATSLENTRNIHVPDRLSVQASACHDLRFAGRPGKSQSDRTLVVQRRISESFQERARLDRSPLAPGHDRPPEPVEGAARLLM